MKSPDPQSKRTQRRKKRGFVSLEISSRKHRRNEKRMASGQTMGANSMGAGGVRHKAGAKVDLSDKKHIQHARGKNDYHS